MDLMSFVQSRNPNKKVVKVEMMPGSRAYRVYFEGGGIGFGGLPSQAKDQNDYGLHYFHNRIKVYMSTFIYND